MLVLSRRPGERIVIDGDIIVEILEILGNRVRLGITAPADVPVDREDRAKALAEFERWFAKLVRANNALIKLRRRLKRLASAEQAFRGGDVGT